MKNVCTPGSLVFIKAGGTVQRMGEDCHIFVSHRMMTWPCLVLSVSNRLEEVGDSVAHVHTVLMPEEGIVKVSGGLLMTQEEMVGLLHERYGMGKYIPFTWPPK